MPRFKVEIRGDDLMRVMTALNAAGVPTIGPASAGFASDPASWTVMKTMTAVVEALAADQAKARVKESLPPDGEWDVSDAGPWGEQALNDEKIVTLRYISEAGAELAVAPKVAASSGWFKRALEAS